MEEGGGRRRGGAREKRGDEHGTVDTKRTESEGAEPGREDVMGEEAAPKWTAGNECRERTSQPDVQFTMRKRDTQGSRARRERTR